ncbi:MAG: hypothetical protein KIS92_00795 [Planctomycetota bacterium]|nr:hypothetical protein [Planctomycetota bacterium]
MEKQKLVKIMGRLDSGEPIAFILPAERWEAHRAGLMANVNRIIADEQEITLAGLVTGGSAMLTAKDVSEEIQREREGTCRSCEYYRFDERKKRFFCDRCGCTLKGHWINMVRKEEALPLYGCKHPQRGKVEGKGWKR